MLSRAKSYIVTTRQKLEILGTKYNIWVDAALDANKCTLIVDRVSNKSYAIALTQEQVISCLFDELECQHLASESSPIDLKSSSPVSKECQKEGF